MVGRLRRVVISVGFVGVLALVAAACNTYPYVPPVSDPGTTATTTTTTLAPTTTVAPTTTSTTVAPTTTTTTATTVPPSTTTTTTVPTTATPLSLLVSQSSTFAILGHSCGGIQEQAFATGFDVTSGYPTGDVYVQTRCGGSGRGGGYTVTTYSAWIAVTWDFAGGAISQTTLSAAPLGLDPTFSTVDAAGDRLYNVLNTINVLPANCTVGNTSYCTYRAYLTVVVPPAPTGVTAVQVGDQFTVGWVPDPLTAALVTSSTITATPVGSTASTLTATVNGTAASGLIGPLQPLTTYQVTVVNTDAGGTSPQSSPVTVSTPTSTIVPSAPTNISALWTAPQMPGDTLQASWAAAVPGDSPIDQYQITITVSDGGTVVPGPFTQTLSGSTLSAGFVVADTFDWTIQVQAHNAAGWGPPSTPIVLPAA